MPKDDDFSEMKEAADKGELTPESLNDKLNQYHEAFRQEFEDKTKKSPDNVDEYTTDFFKKNIHAAAAQVAWLAHNAESESVRLRASQFVIERALTDGRSDGDPIKELLKKLTKNNTVPSPASN